MVGVANYKPHPVDMAEVIKFGRNVISVSMVFLQIQLSYAFTNRKPVVPGRILEPRYYSYSTEPELQMPHEIRAVRVYTWHPHRYLWYP